MHKNVVNSLNIRENFLNFDKIDFGCDWLTLSYSKYIKKFDELMFGVDTDNSNFWVIDIDWKPITYNKIITQNGYWLTFICEFNWVAVPLFQYVRFNSNTKKNFKKSAKITVYGSYFRLEHIGYFEYHSVLKFIWSSSSEDPDITRYDYKIDYFSFDKLVSVPWINEICGYVHNDSTIVEWKEWNKLIDWSVWSSDTWRYKVRYYDKKIDTNKKNKWFLYTDFLDYKSVHRLEIEFLRAFCRGFKLSTINDLEWKILQVLNIDSMWFDSSIFYVYNSESEITIDNANKYIQKYINLSNKLLKAWYSPFCIIEEAIMSQCGQSVCQWLLDDFLSKSLCYKWSLLKKY